MASEPTTCLTCGGDGIVDDDFCIDCGGQGALPVQGVFARIVLKLIDIQNQIDDIYDKCNDIFEQVSE